MSAVNIMYGNNPLLLAWHHWAETIRLLLMHKSTMENNSLELWRKDRRCAAHHIVGSLLRSSECNNTTKSTCQRMDGAWSLVLGLIWQIIWIEIGTMGLFTHLQNWFYACCPLSLAGTIQARWFFFRHGAAETLCAMYSYFKDKVKL